MSNAAQEQARVEPTIAGLVAQLIDAVDDAPPFEIRDAIEVCVDRSNDFAVHFRKRGIYRLMANTLRRALE